MADGYRLYADLGNTTVHMGLFSRDWLADERYTVADLADDDNWEEALLDLLALANRDAEGCLSAAVCAGGPYVADVLGAIEEVTGVVPHLLDPEDDLGIEFEYAPPQSLGRDRILAAVAARDQIGCPVIVIDAGTFITCDLVDAGGNMLPIAIAPGLPALVTSGCICVPDLADRLIEAAVDGSPTIDMPAPNTVSSLRNGIWACLAGTIETLIRLAHGLAGTEDQPPVVTTGGDGNIAGDISPCKSSYHPLLVLDGLRLIDFSRKRQVT